MQALTFIKGGVHPQEHKELTEHLAIEEMPPPDHVVIPLSMHFGAIASPVVKKKQEVQEGELIAAVEKGLGASIHSSVTGSGKNDRITASSHHGSMRRDDNRQRPGRCATKVRGRRLAQDDPRATPRAGQGRGYRWPRRGRFSYARQAHTSADSERRSPHTQWRRM